MMRRYFFECSYNGGAFYGWQIQPKQISVQETIQKYMTRLNSNQPVVIVGCGRTDAGVHAHSSIFHIDFDREIDLSEWIYKLNKMLPTTISIKEGYEVTLDDHARFTAKKRTYRYFIHKTKTPFKHAYSTLYPYPLDFEAMNIAASFLIGTHDFTTFSKANTDVKTHICEVFGAKWIQVNEEEAYFEYTANRFLRNMVRATVGTLYEVGLGKITPSEFKEILQSQDRTKCGGSAAAQGLFLWKVEYLTEIKFFPQRHF